MKKILLVPISIVVLLAVVYAVRLYLKPEAEQIACTKEAKLCPDGSAVGRTGPLCEFEACPSDGVDHAWKLITDPTSGISYRYPERLSTTYISAQEWPPQIEVREQPYRCLESGSEIMLSGQTIKRIVDNREYCLTKVSEGAAGSVFTTYSYAFAKESKTMELSFTLRSSQCGNYDDPLKTACEGERESFDIDGVVDRIVMSIR